MMTPEKNEILRLIPQVNAVLESEALIPAYQKYSRGVVVNATRETLSDLRNRIVSSSGTESLRKNISMESIAEMIMVRIASLERSNLRHVINATGIILHTGLGRAVLSGKAREALNQVTAGYSSLEMDLETGERGRRDSAVIGLLCELTGAESATVVNNNAAATMLILKTLASGKEVIVSRGQLVEIGGSYRIPDVMRESGATLIEVGTTNKTHLRDYRNAINERTGLLLHVHMSNYRIVGFTKAVPVEELVSLGREFNIPVVDDLGSGALLDFTRFGLAEEPTVQASIRAGADAVCFSGDKLLGGPQGGIILGKKEIIERIRKNPLARAVRVGKLTMTALEATLRLFRDEETLLREHPVLRMISMPVDEIAVIARRLARRLGKILPPNAVIGLRDGFSQVGGGSLPTENLPTKLVSISCEGISLDDIAGKLRLGEPAVVCRIQQDAITIDPRTLQPGEESGILTAFETAFKPSH